MVYQLEHTFSVLNSLILHLRTPWVLLYDRISPTFRTYVYSLRLAVVDMFGVGRGKQYLATLPTRTTVVRGFFRLGVKTGSFVEVLKLYKYILDS